MRIDDRFRVNVPVEETWRTLLDIERIAPCLPGAELHEIEGDEYRGVVKVKVGPMSAQYKGVAKLEQVDDDTHTVVIRAVGRDTRGQGNASATITASMVADGTGTDVTIETDLAITGKVAQFGRGVLADVSAKLVNQFVDNLERDVLAGPGAAGTGAAAAAPARPAEGEAATLRIVDSAEAEPVDLLAVSGGSVAKRVAPLAVAALVLTVLWRMLVRRRRRGSGSED
ncbi:MAG: SRPBCC family protein [Acidimicrobiia bacterium]